MKRIAAAIVVGSTVAALSACGGSSGGSTTTSAAAPAGTTTTVKQATGAAAEQYEQQMQSLGGKLSTYFAEVGQADTTVSQKKVIANLHEIQRRLRAAAVQLNAMNAPADVAPDQQKLIKAVREYASDLNLVIVQVKQGHRTALFGISQLQGVKAMAVATEAITHDGYDITGTGTPGG